MTKHQKAKKLNPAYMKFIDTHTHLYVEQFDDDRHTVIKRAIDSGVTRFYLPNIDTESVEGMLVLEKEYPDHCFPMIGLHPCSVKADYKEQLTVMRGWLNKRSFAAIGEIGMDLYWDTTFRKQQEDAFLRQCEWAMESDLPIVIHSRETTEVLIEMIQSINDIRLRGIFHCFTGNVKQAEAITNLGFKLGIGGVATFKNGGLDKTLADVNLEHIVLETDSPYLAPKPHRGKRNESAYIVLVARKLAEIYGVSLAEVAEVTSKNARKIFK